MSAIIRLHPKLPQREPMREIVRRLERAGYALSNVSGKRYAYEARMVVPTLTNVVTLPRRSVVDRMFDFARRPQ